MSEASDIVLVAHLFKLWSLLGALANSKPTARCEGTYVGWQAGKVWRKSRDDVKRALAR